MQNDWRPVVGFEGIYEVSSYGKVRSLDRLSVSEKRKPQRLKGRMLRPGIASTGYPSVSLCRDGRPRSYNVHELVAAAFIGPRPVGHDVDHIDGDRANPALANLRYIPHAVNTRHTTKVNSRSGELGVYPNGSGWMAQIVHDGVTIHLGTFRTIEDAAAARRKYEEEVDYRQLSGGQWRM